MYENDIEYKYRVVITEDDSGECVARICRVIFDHGRIVEWNDLEFFAGSVQYPMKAVSSLQYKYDLIHEAFESEIYLVLSDGDSQWLEPV